MNTLVGNSGGAPAPAGGGSEKEEFLLGFQRLEAEIRGVPEQELVPVNIDVPSAVATVLGALPEIAALRDQMTGLPGFDLGKIDKLRDCALALGHTHGAYRAMLGPMDSVTKLAEEVSAVREVLFADAVALAKRGVFDENRINRLRSGPGYKNIAFDVVGLVQVFREQASAVAGRVQASELERAGQLAQQLVTAVGLREQAPATVGVASLVRQQAFSFFLHAYDEARRAVGFLRWHAGDAEEIAPSLWAGRGHRPSDASAVETQPATPTMGTSPVATTPASASSVMPSSAASAVPVGLPGATPFARS